MNAPFKELRGRNQFKIRILAEQKHKCLECGIGIVWNEKLLTLQLDHIDGNNKNNTRENLRMICPNCHTQTETYGSKNASVEARLRLGWRKYKNGMPNGN